MVEEISPQDVGLLDQAGRPRVDAQVVDNHALGVARLHPFHLHSEVAVGKDVPGEGLSGLAEGVDGDCGSEGRRLGAHRLVAVAGVEEGQLEAVGGNQLDEPLEVEGHGDGLPRSAAAQVVDRLSVIFVSHLQEVVPEDIPGLCGDGEGVGGRGGCAGLEDAAKVGVVGVVGAVVTLGHVDVADIG